MSGLSPENERVISSAIFKWAVRVYRSGELGLSFHAYMLLLTLADECASVRGQTCNECTISHAKIREGALVCDPDSPAYRRIVIPALCELVTAGVVEVVPNPGRANRYRLFPFGSTGIRGGR